MKTALLGATALVALSSLAVAQNQVDATEATPKAKPINPNTVDPAKAKDGLHYDVLCRVSSADTRITEPQTYPPYKPGT